MRMPVKWSLLRVGHCRQFERLARQGGAWKRIDFPSLCVLIEHPTQGIFLYDTGYSLKMRKALKTFPSRVYSWILPVFLNEEETLIHQLHLRGIRPEDIRKIFISHFHADHMAGLRDFPSARFVCMRADYEFIRDKKGLQALRHAFIPELMPDDFAQRVDFVEDCPALDLKNTPLASFKQGFDLLGDGSLVAFPLPGHVPVQMGLQFQGMDGKICLLVGDAVWSLKALLGRELPSKLATWIFHAPEQYAVTMDYLRDSHARAPEMIIIPSHCPDTWARYGAPHA